MRFDLTEESQIAQIRRIKQPLLRKEGEEAGPAFPIQNIAAFSVARFPGMRLYPSRSLLIPNALLFLNQLQFIFTIFISDNCKF